MPEEAQWMRLPSLVRYGIATLYWLVAYVLINVASRYGSGAMVSLLDFKGAAGLTTLVTLLAIGIAGGWLAGLLASRLRLTVPNWWAPSLSAVGIVVLCAAVIAVVRSTIGSGILAVVAWVITLTPTFAGQALYEFMAWRSRPRAAASMPPI